MLTLQRPSAERCSELLAAWRDSPFGYAEQRVLGRAAAPGYANDRLRVQLGSGRACYESARAALRSWRHFDLGWVRAHSPTGAPAVGTAVAVTARVCGVWTLLPSRVIETWDEDGGGGVLDDGDGGSAARCGFTYGTLAPHWEAGEERFELSWSSADDVVHYEIASCSRPNVEAAWWAYPLVRRAQRRFVLDSAAAMARAVGAPGAAPVEAAVRYGDPHHLLGWSQRIGLLAWLSGVTIASPQIGSDAWATAMLLLGVLALAPAAARLSVAPLGQHAARPLGLLGVLHLPAAAALGAACSLPAGPAAAALATPWLAWTALLAWLGVVRLRARGFAPPRELAIAASALFAVVGGLWAFAARLGLRPLGFPDEIVLLTAVHFHHAGLVLPVVGGIAARGTGAFGNVVSAGVVVGVPLVAAGITATRLGSAPVLERVAAWLLAGAALGVAALTLHSARRGGAGALPRLLAVVAGCSLLGGAALAALYGGRGVLETPWLGTLDIPTMRAWHGTLNGIGFGLAGAWSLTLCQERRSRPAARLRDPLSRSGAPR